MSKIFIINGHQPYPFSPGKLNASLTQLAHDLLVKQGHDVRVTQTAGDYDVDTEVQNHHWADVILMQFPVNWMGAPWSFKKYMDEVYTAGMDGRLCNGDGRSSSAPKVNYGMGGTLKNTRYMLSATFNAPAEAFDAPNEPFFQGGSVDDLLQPMHLNMKFFGAKAMPTFTAHDVMKDPQTKADLQRYREHLTTHFALCPEATT